MKGKNNLSHQNRHNKVEYATKFRFDPKLIDVPMSKLNELSTEALEYGDDSRLHICRCKLNVTIDRDSSTYIHGTKRDDIGDLTRKWNERHFIVGYDEMDTLTMNNVINHMGQLNLLNNVT